MIRRLGMENIYVQHKNNASRKIFKRLAFEKNWDVVHGNRLMVRIDGVKYGFSVSPNAKAVCRQLYDDCDGFITYSIREGKVYSFKRDDVLVDVSCNRVSPRGVAAYSAHANFDAGEVVHEVA